MDRQRRARRLRNLSLRDLSPTALAAIHGGGSSLPTETLSLNYEKIRLR